MERAPCRTHELRKTHAWTISESDTVIVGDERIPGANVVAAALLVCGSCSEQYHCALWAIEVDELVGTWAMPIADLRWLKARIGSEGVIHMARVERVPVQVAVRKARAGRV
jgi:hypothetical protein